MKTVVIILYLVAQLPGMDKPIEHQREVASIEECIKEVQGFLNLPPKVVLQEGGMIQASCVMVMPEQKKT